MSATDEVEVVFVKEFSHHLGAKCERNTTIVFTPSHGILEQKKYHTQKSKNNIKI